MKQKIKTRLKRNKAFNKISKNLNEKINISKKSKVILFLLYNFIQKKRKILLPYELLKKAKIICHNPTLTNLQKAIKIYDINDQINFEYLQKCGKINTINYKYIYTLSYENRQKIIRKYNLDKKILKIESKKLFSEFVNFLINEYNENSKGASIRKLEYYKLDNFDKFFIPINEGTKELKYYYFITIIYYWLEISKDKCISSLKYFRKIFEKKEHIDDINKLFYILFRIDLPYFNNEFIQYYKYYAILISIEQDFNEKKKALNIIKDEIIEKFDISKINKDTVFTLKKSKFIFKLNDYYFISNIYDKDLILSGMKRKMDMTYDYYMQNKLNYFDNDAKKNAFFNIFKKILTSKVIKEYYQKIKYYEKYEFPFENDKLINYLWDKLIFAKIDDYWGMTTKEGFGIFINRFGITKSNGLGYGLCIISISHEIITNSLKKIICANEGILEDKSIFSINDVEDKEDNRETYGLYLLDQRIRQITIGGNHYLFNINNWNLSLKQFCKGFEINNILKTPSTLKNELKILKKNDVDVKVLFENVKYHDVTENIYTQSMFTRRGNEYFCSNGNIS